MSGDSVVLGCDDRKILSGLDRRGGITAGDLAREIGWGGSPRSRAQTIRPRLVDLCTRGLARRLDDELPMCWVLTEAALNAGATP